MNKKTEIVFKSKIVVKTIDRYAIKKKIMNLKYFTYVLMNVKNKNLTIVQHKKKITITIESTKILFGHCHKQQKGFNQWHLLETILCFFN